MKNIISIVQEKQERLSGRYNELENLQGDFPLYTIIQSEVV